MKFRRCLDDERVVGLSAAAVFFLSGILSVLSLFLPHGVDPRDGGGLFLGCSFGLLGTIVWLFLVWWFRVCLFGPRQPPDPAREASGL